MDYQTSIIIVSYNNFDITTGPCLKSLLNDKENNRNEIIVVDNASKDDSPYKLKQMASKEQNVKLILNNVNRGFAGGNNDGANIARGDILILLNSDTVIPPGAIGSLSKLLRKNENWALLGPVTNEAGNEQKIFVESTQPEQIIEEGKKWCSHANHDCFKSERLDFFCVAMLKKTYEKLGGLDEQFGQGYFEDTDFSIRANKMGLNMVFTENVFVYHRAGESFAGLGKKFVHRLMRDNRKKLAKKHSGVVKLHHMRERNMYIMNEYILLKREKDAVSCNGLDYRFQNRLSLANNMYPNNLIKKLFYYMRLRSFCTKYYQ